MEKKLTVSRKKAKILTVNRKSHYPIETLLKYSPLAIENCLLYTKVMF